MYENYARIRDKKGLKDSHVARMAGVATSTLSEWKAGKYEPKLITIRKLAAVLDCTIDELINE